MLLAVIAYAATNIWPNLGAGAVDLARGVFGDRFVSSAENFVLSSEDKLKQIQYTLLKTTPTAPWQTASSPASTQAVSPSFDITPTPASILSNGNGTPVSDSSHTGWPPVNVPAFGNTPDEGHWTAYLRDCERERGRLSDLSRSQTPSDRMQRGGGGFRSASHHLHFVPGYTEPKSTVYISRPARIPASDMLPGRILAAFNGGFKAQHGHFGVMVDGVTLIPPRVGFGTVGIYKDGKVVVGAWGTDITSSPIWWPGARTVP